MSNTKRNYSRMIPLVLCLLILSATFLTACKKTDKDPKVRTFISYENGILTWELVGMEGRKYTVKADYTAVDTAELQALSAAADFIPEEEELAAVVGQYIASLYSFDYALHWNLYPEAYAQDCVFGDGITKHTKEEIVTGVSKVVTDTFIVPAESVEVRFKVAGRRVNDAEARAEMESHYESDSLSDFVPLAEMESYTTYAIADLQVIYNGTYAISEEIMETEMALQLYRYQGQWYVHADADFLDDFGIDLADDAKRGEDGFAYRTGGESGTITEIKDGYLRLEGKEGYYLLGDVSLEHRVGDTVVVFYYDGYFADLPMCRFSDGAACQLYRVSAVQAVPQDS